MDDYTSCKDPIQERLEESMPWIGRYILAASIICTLAMAADAFNGFRRRKLWFPCKYFSLNAASLTLLGVAMKLPMDLTTVMMYAKTDLAAKISSMIFMSTAIGNFMSSLGSMNDREVLPNVLALGILVVTIAVDVLIQLILLWGIDDFASYYYIFSTVSMLLCFAMLVSLATTVPSTKWSLESKYQEKQRVALVEEEVLERREAFRIDNRKRYMMKYWVMAQTSSPQFVMARSVVSTTSAVICLISAIVLAFIYLDLFINWRLGRAYSIGEQSTTPYKESPMLILHVQSIGVAIGTIAPVLRWFVVVRFKCSATTTNYKSFRQGFTVEAYWTQALVDWRDNFSGLRINRVDKYYRKCLHDAKWYAVTFCIRLQYVIVLLSKLLVSLSTLLMTPFFLVKQKRHEGSSSTIDKDDLGYLRSYVLLLEDEPELPTSILRNIIREGDKMIQAGRKKQPKSLIHLLKKFDGFNGVGQFDNGDEIPNCWTLPVVTLTSIAIALPNSTAKHNSEQLLRSIDKGLSLAKIVDKSQVENTQLVNIRKAADISWVGVVLYMKWFETDLRRISHECKHSKEVLEKLSSKAEAIVEDSATQDPLNWPPEVVAANSMYRISRTILSSSCSREDDEGLFERISTMIADILAACFTNLPHVITTMCHHNAIEKRETSVREALRLLGETEQIIELLRRQEWPFSDHNKAASIQEWHTLFKGTLTAGPVSESEDHLDVIKVEC